MGLHTCFLFLGKLLKPKLMKNQNIYVLFTIIALFCFGIPAESQNSKWSLKVDYGIQKSFTVLDNNAYAEKEYDFFNRKNEIGNQTGINAEYQISDDGFVGGGFSCVANYATHSFSSATINIDDLRIKHLSTFFQLYYKRGLFQSKALFIQMGMTLLKEKEQKLTIRNNSISFLKEAYTITPGILLGLEYYFVKKNSFEMGVSSKVYWQIFDGYLDNISLSPVVKYYF